MFFPKILHSHLVINLYMIHRFGIGIKEGDDLYMYCPTSVAQIVMSLYHSHLIQRSF